MPGSGAGCAGFCVLEEIPHVQEIQEKLFMVMMRSYPTAQTDHLRSINLSPVISSNNELYPLAGDEKRR